MTKKRVNGVLMDFTEAEEAQRLIDVAHAQSIKDAEVQQATDKASAVSKLEALGLSSSEIDAFTK